MHSIFTIKSNKMTSRFSLRATILALAMLMFIICPFAHSEVQRNLLVPPFRGQFSEFSEWSIPGQSFSELTNYYVNEQGLIRSRPGFYTFMDSVSTSKSILGAINYKKWIEGGSYEYLVFNTNNKIYYTILGNNNINTDISAGVSYSDDGVPVWLIHYNDLYMANGEENPVRWNQSDGNVIQIGYCYYDGTVIFEDTNEVTLQGTHWDSDPYHFRPGWDFTIADSNSNDGTYEISSVDSNVIVLINTNGTAVDLTEETDTGGTYTGIGYPPELTSSRTETVTSTLYSVWFYDNYSAFGTGYDCLRAPGHNFLEEGFVVDQNCTITGAGAPYNGTYNISYIYGYEIGFPSSSFSDAPGPGVGVYKTNVTLSASSSITTINAFNPSCIAGHKSRLFVGGVKEYPTYLFFTVSRLLDTQGDYYFDIWRDRVNTDDGSGHIDLQDKIIALIGDYKDSLIIGCENRIMLLRGDDPGFDLLTPSQALIYHPDPVSLNTGFAGPNAWCEANGDIFFMSKSGLQQFTMVSQGGTSKYTVLSLPINDLINDALKYGNMNKISLKFVKNLNLILINCALSDYTNDSIIAYNIANQSFSKWTFTSGSEPNCLFIANGPDIDPNNASGFPSDIANPYETCWFGSQDGKFWALQQAYDYDRDYEDPNNATNSNFTKTIISAKLNMDNPLMQKTFQRAVFIARELHNYSPDPNYGSVAFYRKIDNGSWSSASTRNFSAISGTAGTAIDQYQFLDMYSSIRGTGRTIQYKIVSSDKFGLELMGILTEYSESGYTPFD